MIKKIKSKFNFLKPKGVGYYKFLEFSQSISDKSDDAHTVSMVILHFYPHDKRPLTTCLNEFNLKVTKKVNYWIDIDPDFENRPAHYFIKADFLCASLDLVGLYNHLSKSDKKDIPTQMAEQVRDAFLKAVSHFKDKYEWIYNPPVTGKAKTPTIGDQYRQEFAEHYRAYAEITYLISKGDAMKFEQVENMRLENYLSLGEYLRRKHIVENID